MMPRKFGYPAWARRRSACVRCRAGYRHCGLAQAVLMVMLGAAFTIIAIAGP